MVMSMTLEKKVHDHWKNENDQDHKKKNLEALYPIPIMID